MKSSFFWLLLLLCGKLLGQVQPAEQNPRIGLNGSLRLSAQYYHLRGEALTQTPMLWQVSGNPVLRLGKLRFPMSFTYQNSQSQFQTNLAFPINRFATSPRWKWGQAHLGQRSMQFTPYTLAGRDFFGAGVEINPGPLRLAAMYGSFRDPHAPTDSLRELPLLLPTFQRRGMAARLGIGNDRSYLDLMAVKVKDQTDKFRYQSDGFSHPAVAAEDNLVVGIDTRAQLFNLLLLRAHLAGSLHTGNLQSSFLVDQLDSLRQVPLIGVFSSLIEPRINTRYGLAMDAEAALNLPFGKMGVQYQQVDPHYRALGTYFLRRDFSAWTAYVRLRAFEQKLSLSLRGGVERNNLADFRAVTQRRLVGSAQLNVVPHRRLILAATYSNFQMDHQPGVVALNDTLRLLQTTQLQGITATFKGPEEGLQWTISTTANRQQVLDQSPLAVPGNGFELLNGNLRVGLRWPRLGLRMTPNLTYRQTLSPIQQTRLGGGLNISQQLWDKRLRLQTSTNVQRVSGQGELPRVALNSRLSLRLRLGQHHQISVRWNYLHREIGNPEAHASQRGQLSYAFNF